MPKRNAGMTARDHAQDQEVNAPAQTDSSPLRLRPFDQGYADYITRWVGSSQQLRWLAPGTAPPITAAKVLEWKKDGGHPLLLVRDGQREPLGYGELNPMPKLSRDLWLGHVIIRPELRGRGFGQILVSKLLTHAFNELQATRISLIVFPDNTAAIRCYSRAGFETAGEEYHQFATSPGMQKLLRLEIDPARLTLTPAG